MILLLFLLMFSQFYLSRHLILENLSLRQQLLVYKRTIRKPRIRNFDRIFWILLFRFHKNWKDDLAIVKPATVIRWHRSATRIFWRWISRSRGPGRPRIHKELKQEIQRMARENPTWGPERILGELIACGYNVHLNTVRKYMPVRRKNSPGGSWKNFIDLHLGVTAAMDFLVVYSWNFSPLFVFFVIHHKTREILHINVTSHPNLIWLRSQLREAFSDTETCPGYLVFDNDPVFRYSMDFMKNILSITPLKTTPHSPWENGYAERLVRTIREDVLDHVIPLSENHLRKLLLEYVKYYNEDRTHSSRGRDSPSGRERAQKPPDGRLIAMPRVRGIHHKYIPPRKIA